MNILNFFNTTKLIIAASVVVSLSLVSCGEEEKTTSSEQTCFYSHSESTETLVHWTAFKTTARVPVSGQFNQVNVSTEGKSTKVVEVLRTIKFNIPTSSTNSANPERDAKIVNSFFGSMDLTDLIIGHVKNAEGDNKSGFCVFYLSLNNVERDFLELTKVIRGYLFLVNVVMTGTANEFLFLARELNKLVTKKFTITNTAVKETLEATRFGGNFFSAIGIIIAAATALFMFYRIILPINKITQIFKRLSEEKSVLSIPDLYRRDEIGLLARSADVFREKNQQTKELLQNSQDLVAEQEALNSKLVQSSQKLEHATASKSMFLANMSHEIRTPMNGIIGMLDIVLRSKLSDTHRRQLSQAAYSGQILMSVINDILDFTKIEAGKLDVENVNFSLDSLFDNLLANISNRAREKNLSIRFKASPNLPTQLNGDPLRLSQILLNLCSNAIKFTRNGEVSINVDFKAHQDNSKITVYFDITDTGIGMDHEQVGKVFDSFTQADGSTSRKYGGSGLGLSIVKQLVELMNGEISVHSKVNKGSTFSVEVELTKTDDNSEIVAELPAYVGKLFYFVHGSDGFLNKPYIEKMGLNYQLIAIYKLATTLENIGNEDTVLLDISNQDTFINYQNEINKVLEKSISIGFVTQSQPSNLANQLSAPWQIDW